MPYQVSGRRNQIIAKRINTLEKDGQRVKEELKETPSVLDFSYIYSLFRVANDKSILHHDNIQKQKLQNLLKISSSSIFILVVILRHKTGGFM